MGSTETLDCQVKNDVEVIFHSWTFFPSNGDAKKENIELNPRYIISYLEKVVCIY